MTILTPRPASSKHRNDHEQPRRVKAKEGTSGGSGSCMEALRSNCEKIKIQLLDFSLVSMRQWLGWPSNHARTRNLVTRLHDLLQKARVRELSPTHIARNRYAIVAQRPPRLGWLKDFFPALGLDAHWETQARLVRSRSVTEAPIQPLGRISGRRISIILHAHVRLLEFRPAALRTRNFDRQIRNHHSMPPLPKASFTRVRGFCPHPSAPRAETILTRSMPVAQKRFARAAYLGGILRVTVIC